MKRMQILAILLIAVLVLSACNLPDADTTPTVSEADMVLTAAAQTVEAQRTEIASGQPTATWTPLPTNTQAVTVASNTPAPTQQPAATQGQASCDVALFVTDVTVPDGTDYDPGETFTKTWRLKNNGSCTWTSGYDLIFASGDAMGGPAAQQLTSGSVAPGATVDVSVELTAPDEAGTYKGFWRLRNASGVNFGVSGNNAFWVEIEVLDGEEDGSTPTVTVTVPASTDEVTLTAVNSGSVRKDGSVSAPPNVGDTDGDLGAQAFFSFDISSIPSGSTITAVSVNFSAYDTLDNPFGGLGCLRAYAGNFFPLDSGDYVSSPSGAVARWCDEFELSNPSVASGMVASLQSAVGSSTYQLRLQFSESETDGDGDSDMVRFGTVKITVEYAEP
ncbi:MAG: hypothetical protein JXB38_22630 [Anaerolineales bacterium]|nr:hypothetical protein [Anaerolineales bacterium]